MKDTEFANLVKQYAESLYRNNDIEIGIISFSEKGIDFVRVFTYYLTATGITEEVTDTFGRTTQTQRCKLDFKYFIGKIKSVKPSLVNDDDSFNFEVIPHTYTTTDELQSIGTVFNITHDGIRLVTHHISKPISFTAFANYILLDKILFKEGFITLS